MLQLCGGLDVREVFTKESWQGQLMPVYRHNLCRTMHSAMALKEQRGLTGTIVVPHGDRGQSMDDG